MTQCILEEEELYNGPYIGSQIKDGPNGAWSLHTLYPGFPGLLRIFRGWKEEKEKVLLSRPGNLKLTVQWDLELSILLSQASLVLRL